MKFVDYIWQRFFYKTFTDFRKRRKTYFLEVDLPKFVGNSIFTSKHRVFKR